MRMKVLGAAAIIALLAGPVFAQQQAPMQRYGEKDKEKTFNEKEQEKDAERAYRRSLDAVPEKGPVDPWGNARSVETKGDAKAAKSATKSDAKAAPPKPKTTAGDAAK